jgi:hypothetical protein
MSIDPEVISKAIVDVIRRALEPRDRRIATLEAKCVLLEKAMSLSSKELFMPGAVQDDDGTPWVCARETRDLPGDGDDWRPVQ